MIRLHPIPDARHECPGCGGRLAVRDWYMPGMRMLAEVHCAACERDFYGDLPAGHGLPYPALLDRASGEVYGSAGPGVFAENLRASYASRSSAPVRLEVERLRPLRRPVLLNCLDWLYGHSLLKLLNAQFYLDRTDLDLVVMVPRFLRWMVPDGVAEVWTVDLPLSRGTEWNDPLAAEIRSRVAALGECGLSVALSHPHPDDFRIERFTGVLPFDLDAWGAARPVVTFVWRGDRPWVPAPTGSLGEAVRRRWSRLTGRGTELRRALRRVATLEARLREALPTVDFAVVGLGTEGSLSGGIVDLRTSSIDAATERAWCERYARSHVVIGVHGSNMLLPSAHAGGVVELVPEHFGDSRWGNLLQDVLVRGGDVRDALFRYRFLPVDTRPEQVAGITASLIRDRQSAWLHFSRATTDHFEVARRWDSVTRQFASASMA